MDTGPIFMLGTGGRGSVFDGPVIACFAIIFVGVAFRFSSFHLPFGVAAPCSSPPCSFCFRSLSKPNRCVPFPWGQFLFLLPLKTLAQLQHSRMFPNHGHRKRCVLIFDQPFLTNSVGIVGLGCGTPLGFCSGVVLSLLALAKGVARSHV